MQACRKPYSHGMKARDEMRYSSGETRRKNFPNTYIYFFCYCRAIYITCCCAALCCKRNFLFGHKNRLLLLFFPFQRSLYYEWLNFQLEASFCYRSANIFGPFSSSLLFLPSVHIFLFLFFSFAFLPCSSHLVCFDHHWRESELLATMRQKQEQNS